MSIMVNATSDGFGRTLLAWRNLVMIFRFMADNPMSLYVIIRQRYGGKNE